MVAPDPNWRDDPILAAFYDSLDPFAARDHAARKAADDLGRRAARSTDDPLMKLISPIRALGNKKWKLDGR